MKQTELDYLNNMLIYKMGEALVKKKKTHPTDQKTIDFYQEEADMCLSLIKHFVGKKITIKREVKRLQIPTPTSTLHDNVKVKIQEILRKNIKKEKERRIYSAQRRRFIP